MGSNNKSSRIKSFLKHVGLHLFLIYVGRQLKKK